ncbi:MAG: aminoglycoside phosphotransferase family protein, partial [Halobacteriales archaeon]|nr:aminoglycoside phosphotransferase family protein [Halobacteriales archaeon]
MPVPPSQLDRIKDHRPDLEISSVEVNTDGLVNDVVVVNRERVFRFAKYTWARELMASEALILGLLRDRVTLSIPELEMLDEDLCTYRFLPGEATTRDTLLRMPATERRRALEQMGQFLTQLHQLEPSLTVGLPPSDAARDLDAWTRLYDDVRSTLFPHMFRHQRDWVDQHFAPVMSGELALEVVPVLVHADLASYHVLHDPTTRQLTAVIDFGTAGLGDPAVD